MASGMGIEKGVDILIAVGIGAFVLVVILALLYQGYATTKTQINSNLNNLVTGQGTTTPSVNATYDTAANSLTLKLTGTTAWISATTPLSITITGNEITTYATNSAAASSTKAQTQTYSITSATSPATLGTNAGNFLNIQSITVSGQTAAAYPSFGVNVSQSYTQEVTGSNTLTTNTIFATTSGTASYTLPGVISNFTTNGSGLSNTYGSNLGLAVFVLVMAVVILVIILALRSRGGGGFLGG